MNKQYDDIINLPHHVSANRPQMSMINRAAQFSPFAALTGFDAAVAETARLTQQQIELGESAIDMLDRKLFILTEHICEQPEIVITYFLPDEKKDGGAYVSANGRLRKIDDYERVIILMDDKKIPIHDIYDVECNLFENLP